MASSSHGAIDECDIDEGEMQKLYGPQQEWEAHTTDVEPEFLGACAESLIPRVFTPDDIKQAFDLWAFPEEAYPETPEVVYTLQNQTNPKGTESILVLLWKQAFKTKPLHKKTCTLELLEFTSMWRLGCSGEPIFYGQQCSRFKI